MSVTVCFETIYYKKFKITFKSKIYETQIYKVVTPCGTQYTSGDICDHFFYEDREPITIQEFSIVLSIDLRDDKDFEILQALATANFVKSIVVIIDSEFKEILSTDARELMQYRPYLSGSNEYVEIRCFPAAWDLKIINTLGR
jgi:hypothetical protein